jgi:acetyl-CoA carboxylase carboxyltransferase component
LVSFDVPLRSGVRGAVSAGIAGIGPNQRRVVLASMSPERRRGALDLASSETLTDGALMAARVGLPLVAVISSSGVDVHEGVAGLHGWGRAAAALSACSGRVPVVFAVVGPTLAGPALLLGIADAVAMTPEALAYVSGPAAVASLTGVNLAPAELGGPGVHSRRTGVAALEADNEADALDALGALLDYLPDNADRLSDRFVTDDPFDRPTPDLASLLPDRPTGSYDVREVARSVADDAVILELRAGWAPQLVTALARIDGVAVGVIANQPMTMAGTLDIAASQKGARFVAFCDSFNLPLLTLVDTPGFMPGKDLEWRGMIRHGAQLVFSYAQASVPRICLILRKAYGGAYIVMDSKAMGSDLCLAWPNAEVAVMGAQGAVQILHRRADAATQQRLVEEYSQTYLNPYQAAERGFVDEVIDPADTRAAIASGLRALRSKQELLIGHKHANGPL